MGIRKYKPYTPSRRFMSTNDFAEVTEQGAEKSLLAPLHRTGGRNNQGRTTMWTRAGGHKRRYRVVTFKRSRKTSVPATVKAIHYDPNRSANLALLVYADGEKQYILAPNGIQVGDRVQAGPDAEIRPGNALPLSSIPVGTLVHAIEYKAGKGAQVCRGAGTFAQIMARDEKYVLLRLPSGEMRYFPVDAYATVGVVGNLDHSKVKIGKAGRSRWLGRRPSVRGIAMNPVDHPHGGGEGRGKGNHPQTPWGQPTKGYRTRKKKKASSRLIMRRAGKK